MGEAAWIVTHRNAVGVLLPDALGLGLALLERVLVLELGAHVGGCCGGGWLMGLLLEICRLNRVGCGVFG